MHKSRERLRRCVHVLTNDPISALAKWAVPAESHGCKILWVEQRGHGRERDKTSPWSIRNQSWSTKSTTTASAVKTKSMHTLRLSHTFFKEAHHFLSAREELEYDMASGSSPRAIPLGRLAAPRAPAPGANWREDWMRIGIQCVRNAIRVIQGNCKILEAIMKIMQHLPCIYTIAYITTTQCHKS